MGIKYSKDIEESMARIKQEDAEDAPYRNAKLSNWKPEAHEPTFCDGIERKTPKKPIDRDKLNSIIDDLNKTDDPDMNVLKRRYRLLKDLPTFKAGSTFYISPKGSLVSDNEFSKGIVAYARSTLAKFPSILTDWLEEIKDEPLIPDTECREIMRLWADRCGVKTVMLFGSEFRYGGKSICFGVDFGLEHLKRYTIDELCGEEEE